MRYRSFICYLILLAVLGAAFIGAAKLLGQSGAYLAQGYMLSPALAAIFTRLCCYPPGFKDANLRLGKIKDYLKFWLFSLGITALSYLLFTVLGGITWDFTGQAFLARLTQQLAAAGKDIQATLLPGFTPQLMLLLFFFGGLTVFNILPGIVMGFGEEFGHRGFMFPQLYRIKPWVGFIIGGLIWYAWHLPLTLVVPATATYPLWQTWLNHLVLALGSICAFTYLAYVYVRSESVWVTAVAHITLNNAAASFSYFAIVKNQLLANLGLTLTMLSVVGFLYYRKQLGIFAAYFAAKSGLAEGSGHKPSRVDLGN